MGRKGVHWGEGKKLHCQLPLLLPIFHQQVRRGIVTISGNQSMHAHIPHACDLFYCIMFSYLSRYTTRCLAIPFHLPQLNLSIAQYTKIVEGQENISPSVGFFIGLGDRFFKEGGIKEVDETLIPLLKDKSASAPRVIPSYGILMWFTLQVCTLNII